MPEDMTALILEYPFERCFQSAVRAVALLEGYTIESRCEQTGSIRIRMRRHFYQKDQELALTLTPLGGRKTRLAIGFDRASHLPHGWRRPAAELVDAIVQSLKQADRSAQNPDLALSFEQRLEKLQQLYQRSVITLEEFERKKQALLDSL